MIISGQGLLIVIKTNSTTIKKVAYNSIGIILFGLAGLVSSFGTTTVFANETTNHYYGTRYLSSMVKEDKLVFSLLGGVHLAIRDDETKYTLTDHLHSTRLTVGADNSISNPADYTPFGNNPNPASGMEKLNHYTGMIYEPETATYDYHARAYDLSLIHISEPTRPY